VEANVAKELYDKNVWSARIFHTVYTYACKPSVEESRLTKLKHDILSKTLSSHIIMDSLMFCFWKISQF